MSDPNLNPGSDEAIANGCRCPVLDNSHGKGDGPFWISELCPIHTETKTDPSVIRSWTPGRYRN